jgi:Tetratricopeptide repeat
LRCNRAALHSGDTNAGSHRCRTAQHHNSTTSRLFGFCRSHYASVLIRRGRWTDAEAELEAASQAFERGAPALVFEGILRLAELRRRQGRLDEAAELCERIEWHPAAQLCLAEIALDRGDAPGARDLVSRHLRALPEGERLGRAPGLEPTSSPAGTSPLAELALQTGSAEEAERRRARARAALDGIVGLQPTR